MYDKNVDHKKVAVITGAGSGIGRACAIKFAKNKSCVVVVDSNKATGEETVKMVKSEGSDAIFCQADVSNERECLNFADSAIKRFGQIDVLVANAATRSIGTILESNPLDWDKLYDVNFKGVMFCCRAVLPRMIEMNTGSIILLGSVSPIRVRTNMVVYDALKYALTGLVYNLAAENGKYGIRVNGVRPGFIDTEYTISKAKSLGSEGERKFKEMRNQKSVLGRTAKPEEIASVIYFLGDTESSFVTGQLLTVDGGVSLV